MTQSDPYLIFNVGPSASEQQIVRAYRRLAKIYHPDINERENADSYMQELNWAYELLKDAEARAEYDREHPVPSASERRMTAEEWRLRSCFRDRTPSMQARAGWTTRTPHRRSSTRPRAGVRADEFLTGAVAAMLLIAATILLVVWVSG